MKSLLRKIAKLRVLVIGDVMLDHYIWGDAQRISPEAPVPVVDFERDSYSAGGAANVALNLAALGAKATIAGFFGDDEAGDRLSRILVEKKIATIATPGTGDTIVKTRILVRRQQLCRLDRESPPPAYRVTASQAPATSPAPQASRQAMPLTTSERPTMVHKPGSSEMTRCSAVAALCAKEDMVLGFGPAVS